ncbi:MAG TPA: helix-turn-helix domain-containing protein [Patescibacteria group bacterium]|nr:helix-turn-helix domain-containing protein [Patescibacteria group bacterium]
MQKIHTQSGKCYVAETLKVIGSKWTMMILHNLFEGRNRFGQLQRELKTISPKTLSQRLDELEKTGILRKKIFSEVPLHVEYYLTAKGLSLKKVFLDLESWGRAH